MTCLNLVLKELFNRNLFTSNDIYLVNGKSLTKIFHTNNTITFVIFKKIM